MLDIILIVANFSVRWCTIICSSSTIVTGGARHCIAVLRQLQVVSILTHCHSYNPENLLLTDSLYIKDFRRFVLFRRPTSYFVKPIERMQLSPASL